jgi:hypothetical protein
MNGNQQRDNILLYFLKLGLSARDLDNLAGYDAKTTKGFKSWRIIQSFGLNNADHRGKLFAFNPQESKTLIKKIVNTNSPNILEGAIPQKLRRFEGVFVLAENEEQFRAVFSGVDRNMVHSHFTPFKKLFPECQHPTCSNPATDCAHWGKNRPEIFIDAARKSVVETIDGLKKFDVLQTMHRYLDGHITKKKNGRFDYHVRFLCKTHHNLYDEHIRKGNTQEVKALEKLIQWTHPPL